ncbi:MAG TPA: PIN domain-containing protein [Thermoanaerobaculia bacterium]|nr:PIN domain-containing protein [Thermoanaerobaculia bacterium]
MRGYLIDANHIGAWEKASAAFMVRLNQKPPERLIFISVVTLGELEWGLSTTTTTDSERRKQGRAFIDQELRPYALDLTVTTSGTYAEILRRIWHAHPPANSRVRTEAHLLSLGVDINDVWMVAAASERGLTVLTEDKMSVIRAAAPHVEFECWN